MIRQLLALTCRKLLESILIIAAGITALAAWVPRVLGRRAAPSSGHRGTPPKPPSTIGIVFAEPQLADVSLQAVANLACWSADLGIHHVYLYDPAGHLRRSQELLASILEAQSVQHGLTMSCQAGWTGLQELQQRPAQQAETTQQLQRQQLQPKQQHQQPVQQEQPQQQQKQEQHPMGHKQAARAQEQKQKQAALHQQSTSICEQAATAGSLTNSHKHITVHVLGPEDAWAPVLAVARQLPSNNAQSKGVLNGGICGLQQNAPDGQDPASLSQTDHSSSSPALDAFAEMAAMAGPAILREPQLLLVYGPVLTLAGYPPFHTRSCEIYHMGPMCLARREQLAATLASFCCALQRHGK